MQKKEQTTMLQIQDTLVSLNIIDKYFVCNLNVCKGNCCVYGDYGAPLESTEIDIIKSCLDKIKPYLTTKGKEALNKQGLKIKDDEDDFVTPLINDKECAFTYYENNIAKCAIEKAYINKETDYKKPVSCHLYPIRITKYKTFTAVNFHQWEICKPAIALGNKQNVPVYVFLKDALIRQFGAEWYSELEQAVKVLEEGRNKQ